MIVWHLSFSPMYKLDWSMASLLLQGSSVATASLLMQRKGSELASCLKTCYVTLHKVFHFQTYTQVWCIKSEHLSHS